jgi:hypothetical protein
MQSHCFDQPSYRDEHRRARQSSDFLLEWYNSVISLNLESCLISSWLAWVLSEADSDEWLVGNDAEVMELGTGMCYVGLFR